MGQINFGIVGASGMAGREAVAHQDYLERKGKNYADLTIVTGSERTAGTRLGEVWGNREGGLSELYPFWEPQECPMKDLEVQETDPELIARKADYVISALPSGVAEKIEPELKERGVNVFSNAGRYRWEEDIPLMIPEVNPSHIEWIREQDTEGKQVNNPNCTTAGFVPLLNALVENGYSLERVQVDTKQAISGKGGKIRNEEYQEGISGNVVDDWSTDKSRNREEMKSEIEPQKILENAKKKERILSQYESVKTGGIQPQEADILPIFANTNRVPTQYGHLETLNLEFENEVSSEHIRELLENYAIPEEIEGLPSTPKNLFKLKDSKPEPREDVFEEDGMATVVEGIRQITPQEISLYTLSHNLRKGATWTARHSMELYLREFEDYF